MLRGRARGLSVGSSRDLRGTDAVTAPGPSRAPGRASTLSACPRSRARATPPCWTSGGPRSGTRRSAPWSRADRRRFAPWLLASPCVSSISPGAAPSVGVSWRQRRQTPSSSLLWGRFPRMGRPSSGHLIGGSRLRAEARRRAGRRDSGPSATPLRGDSCKPRSQAEVSGRTPRVLSGRIANGAQAAADSAGRMSAVDGGAFRGVARSPGWYAVFPYRSLR